ncbi:MAG TPA: NAD(P)H-hydrate epimerase, partial [Candidatus Dormibacteraeota bacterium]
MTTASRRQRRYGALPPDRIAALDAAAVDAGVAIVMLMEVAGWQVARCAWRMLQRRPAPVLVLAGRGNNGGDGLVAARHLRAWGCAVEAVVMGDEERLRGAAVDQLAAARGAGVPVSVRESAAGLVDSAATAALCVDALLGTGLRSAPREPDAGAIAALEGARVLSVDVPSGLDAGTGRAHDPCVTAEVTCTLTAVKSGLWTAQGRARAGRIVVADIGMPATAWDACGLRPPTAVRARALLPVPE